MLLNLGDSGRLRLEMEKLDILDVIREIVEDFNEEDHSFDFKEMPDLKLLVIGDRAMLQKVFQNMYENAFKYNRPGGKVFTRIRADGDGKKIFVDIGNNGNGIPEELQPNVFDRFFRAMPSRSRRIEGTGLGLSIVREILSWHGGSVSLLVSKDDWTEFRIQLPLL